MSRCPGNGLKFDETITWDAHKAHLDKEKLNAGLTNVVTTNIDHQPHVGISVLCRLAPGAYLVHDYFNLIFL